MVYELIISLLDKCGIVKLYELVFIIIIIIWTMVPNITFIIHFYYIFISSKLDSKKILLKWVVTTTVYLHKTLWSTDFPVFYKNRFD